MSKVFSRLIRRINGFLGIIRAQMWTDSRFQGHQAGGRLAIAGVFATF